MTKMSRRRFLRTGAKATAGLLVASKATTGSTGVAAFVQALWCGALAPDSARVNARIDHDSSTVRVLVSAASDLSNPIVSVFQTAEVATNNRMVGFEVSGLLPDQQYYYGIESAGVVDTTSQGRFRTPPSGPHTFTFATSACADTGSSHPVFDTIRALDPLFFLHMGDMHYEDIAVDNVALFRSAYDAVLASAAQSALYKALPIAYMWDDHDFGPNDSDSTSPGRSAARQTYQEYVPHYPLEAGSGDVPIYQTFTVGRVRFIVTDLRSERSPKDAPDDANKSMMGASQKAWFKDQLLQATGRFAAIIWVSTVPWIGVATPGADFWAGYSTERQELADFIRDNQIEGLVMLSGDAHAVALDDGSNSDYATGGGAGFPVLVAAALDRPGKDRGGPYSHGSYPGGGQFGLVTVTDGGSDHVAITLSGRDAAGNVIVEYTLSRSCCSRGRIFLPVVSGG